MEVFLTTATKTCNACGEYDPETKALTVKKGSRVSPKVSHAYSFRAADSIEKLRKEYVKNGIVQEDIAFKSASTAANFVTGSSTNGLLAWKDSSKRCLKSLEGK